MPADPQHDAPATSAPPRRSPLWDGVLPETLGLCFVAIIFGGFAACYFALERSWHQQAHVAQQAETQVVSDALATSLGALAAIDETAASQWLQGTVGRVPNVRAVRWQAADNAVRLAWPPSLPDVPGVPAATAKDEDNESVSCAASSAVRSPDGAPLGTLRIERRARVSAGDHSLLLGSWGAAAGVTLVVFAAFYHRLRRHLRPLAAIQRNLECFATGSEEDLATLTLSESLGRAAHGWNQVIARLREQRERLAAAQQGDATTSVLARFESAVFRRVVDRLPFGVLWIGENHAISYANAAAGALVGRPAAELSGLALNTAIPNPSVVQAVVAAQARKSVSLAVDDTRGQGEQETTLRYRIQPLSEGGKGGDTLVTVEDVSQLKEGERARDNFLYHVTHELRTPLTNIHAYAETLTRPDFDDEQTRKECYNVLISETQRLSHLVEDILSISQMEVGSARFEVGEVDLVRLLRQMVQDNLGGADEKRIDLTLAVPPKVPKISGDKSRLSVLLNNLIGNAIKYTPAAGKVHVQLEVDDTHIRIGIVDTGIGIAPKDQEHVFEKFYRAADDAVQTVPGTGLGLALAREVARLHGGEIYLKSELGKGSTFTIELPLPAASRAEVTVR